MNAAFYAAGAAAIFTTVMAITRLNAMHALLYLIASLLAVAVVFYTLGAAFIAALEVIIYAGAIMVLFIFVVMLLNLGPVTVAQERELLRGKVWLGPVLLTGLLLAEFFYAIWQARAHMVPPAAWIPPKQVGLTLYGPYLIGVELVSLLLTGALVGAYHLGRRVESAEDAYGDRAARARAGAGGDPVRAGAGGIAGAPERGVHPDVH